MPRSTPIFEERLAGYYSRPKRNQHLKEKKLSDLIADFVVPPYVLLCGLMVIAGMMALSGLLELAIAAGIITLVVNYVRFGTYAPHLFGKFPHKLFKEIDAKGHRTKYPITDKKRLYLMIAFVFGFSIISAIAITFFSLMLMKTAFINLGISGIMALGGYSLVPALALFGAVCLLCTWPMFSDGASNLFARVDLWDRLKSGARKFFALIPDESLLLPEESLDSVSPQVLKARQLLRMTTVIALLGLAVFGNFIVAQAGFVYMFSCMGLGGAGVVPAEYILSTLALLGGSVFMISVMTNLMTLSVLALSFTWREYMLPVDFAIKDKPVLRYTVALLASPFLLPLLVFRGIIGFALTEYKYFKETLVSSQDTKVADRGMFHDADTFFEDIRCNTKNIYFNLCVNLFIITPLTFLAGIGIFLKQHITLFAILNGINSGVTSFDGQAPLTQKILAPTGYGAGSLSFGCDGLIISYLNGPRQDEDLLGDPPSLKMVLFGFVLSTNENTNMDSSHYSNNKLNTRKLVQL